MKSSDLYLTIASAVSRMSDLGLPPLNLGTDQVTSAPGRGEKPIPHRKRRYHAKAEERALRRYDGAQKLLKLLEPAGVRHDARAMDTLTRRHGI